MAFQLKLDTVQATEFSQTAVDGRYLRTGLLIAGPSDIPLAIPAPDPVIKSMNALGMPQLGDPLPLAGYEDWIVRGHIIRPQTYKNYVLIITYQWLGALQIRDTSTLSSVPSELNPTNFFPFVVKFTRPGTTQASWKSLRLPAFEPLRHLTYTKTVQFEARETVIQAFGGVNDALWNGLPSGYWLLSGLEGQTIDNGRTYTYSATFSTRQKRDWSEYSLIKDDQGHSTAHTKAQIAQIQAVMGRTYRAIWDDDEHYTVSNDASTPPGAPVAPPLAGYHAYSMDNSVNGFIRAANLACYDFTTIFGVS
jgi:hypothetical protein